MANVLDVAAISMSGDMRRVEAVAHNIANVATPGFKRMLSASGSAAVSGAGAAADRAADTSAGIGVGAMLNTDLGPGRLSQTGNSLHLALAGNGFFTLRAGEKLLFTRAGAFERADDGRLVNPEGAALQADGGDLIIGAGPLTVTADGTVIEGDRPVGRLQIVDFGGRPLLVRAGASSFHADPASATRVDTPIVKQGFLEAANVDAGREMVHLIEAMRRFELGQKLALAHEDMMDRALRRIGDLQG
jgi:flagellar basal-body rod protein FlgG